MVEVVREEVNRGNLIFPGGIPSKRNRFTYYKIHIIFIILVISVALYNVDFKILYDFIILSLFYVIVDEFLSRTLLLYEEKNHLQSRYKNSYLKLLKAAYYFNWISTITICAVSFLFFSHVYSTVKTECLVFSMILFITEIYRDNIKMNECPMKISKSLDDSLGLDYGSGIANSYFEGYLNIILPDFGDERMGLLEMITNYESKNEIEFGARKIFILIPLSGRCPPKIDSQSRIAHDAGALDSRVIHRAGTQGRVYHASVYKLIPDENERPIYVCAEYATPLQTLNECMNRNSVEAARYKRYYPELVTNFYMTLRKLVKKNYNYCELIYYKDVNDEGDILADLDVGRLILERMNNVQ